jgi:beta-phosphoglucomutase-like phosphatase (HAD superfamily)
VVFDADSALAAELDDPVLDGDIAPRTGLIDSVMSLFVAGIWVGVVSTRPRARVETLVRQLIGDGLVETIVTVDDLPDADAGSACGVELYRLALWEMGITPRGALAIAGSSRGLRTSAAAGLPTVVVTTGPQFVGAAEIRAGYDDPEPLLAAGCQRTHRRWWIRQLAARVA